MNMETLIASYLGSGHADEVHASAHLSESLQEPEKSEILCSLE